MRILHGTELLDKHSETDRVTQRVFIILFWYVKYTC